jgi:hypothetical protein
MKRKRRRTLTPEQRQRQHIAKKKYNERHPERGFEYRRRPEVMERNRAKSALRRRANPESFREEWRKSRLRKRHRRILAIALEALRAAGDASIIDNPFLPKPPKPRKKYKYNPTEEQKRRYAEKRNAKMRRKYLEDQAFRKQKLELNKGADRSSYFRAYLKRRRLVDPVFKLRMGLAGRITRALKVKGWKKYKRTEQLLGCPVSVAVQWIEFQFKEGMSWDNHGKWHIDHKIPLATAKTPEEIERLFHYTNLQPLWALDNWKKGGRI